MIKTELSLPELGLIAGTRALLGAGIALLLADKLNAEQRQAVGWTLVGVGALTTIPLAIDVFSARIKPKIESPDNSKAPTVSIDSHAN